MRRARGSVSTNSFHVMLDVLFGLIAYLAAVIISGNFLTLNAEFPCAGLAFLLVYITCQTNERAYNTATFFYLDRFAKYISKSWLFSVFVSFILLFLAGRLKFNIFYVLYPVFFYALMFVSLVLARRERKRNLKSAARVILVGDKKHFEKIVHFMERSNLRLNIVGYVSYDPAPDSDYLGSIKSL